MRRRAFVFVVIMRRGRAARMRRPLAHLCGRGKRAHARAKTNKKRQDKTTDPGNSSIALEASATGLPRNAQKLTCIYLLCRYPPSHCVAPNQRSPTCCLHRACGISSRCTSSARQPAYGGMQGVARDQSAAKVLDCDPLRHPSRKCATQTLKT